MSINTTNFIDLIRTFESTTFDYNYVLIKDIQEIFIKHLKLIVKETPDFLDDDYFYEDDKQNYKEFALYHIKESIPNIINDNRLFLEEQLFSSHSNLRNYVWDLNSISNLHCYRHDYDGEPMELYFQCVAELVIEKFEEVQDEYINKQFTINAHKIADYFLNAYYSPRTEIGIKRFEKEREKLFEEE